MNIQPSTAYEAVIDVGETGLVGTIGTRVNNNLGATTTAFSSANITEIAVGVYAANTRTSPGTAGQYTIIWTRGSGGEVLGVEDLLVTTDAVTAVPGSNLYVTTDQLKTTLELAGTTYADDDIDLACEAASRAIDGYTNSRFYPTTETRYYTATWFGPRYSDGFTNEITGSSDVWLGIDDAVTVTAVTVDTDGNGSYETTWVEGTDFYLDPANAALEGQPSRRLVLRSQAGRTFPSYDRAIKVVGSFGWAAAPAQVRQAAVILAGRFLKRSRETPYGILTVTGDAVAAARLGRIDPDVAFLLDTLPGRKQVLFV